MAEGTKIPRARRKPPEVEVPLTIPRFDRKEALQAYLDWCKYGTKPYLHRAVMLALPMVSIVTNRMHILYGRRGEVASEGHIIICETIYRRRFTWDVKENPFPFRLYAYFLRREVWQAMRAAADRINYHEYLYGSPELPYGDYSKQPRFKEVELRLFLEKLPAALLESIEPKVRFTGRERDAVLWIAQRLAYDRLIPVKMLKTKFGVTDPEFLISYTTFLLRNAVYEMRAAHDGFVVGDWTDLTMGIDPENCVERGELTNVPDLDDVYP